MDEMTLTLNNPLTEEDWELIEDADFDKTNSIEFHTKHGKTVKFVKCTDERTGDTISRRQAIEALQEHRNLFCDNTPETFSKLSYAEKSRVDELDMAIATLINLPSAQSQDIARDIATIIENEKDMRVIAKNAQPEIIRCKECRWGREVCGNIECFVDINVPPEYHGYEWFCPNGGRRTDG